MPAVCSESRGKYSGEANRSSKSKHEFISPPNRERHSSRQRRGIAWSRATDKGDDAAFLLREERSIDHDKFHRRRTEFAVEFGMAKNGRKYVGSPEICSFNTSITIVLEHLSLQYSEYMYVRVIRDI